MTTVIEAVNRVELLLSQVSGENVQLYAEDRIIDMLQNSYNTLFDKLWWPHRMRRETVTLNGTSGEATTTFTALTKFEDIKHIYRVGDRLPIPELSLIENPDVITGSRARFYEPSQTSGKIFKCYPITSTDQVTVLYRTRQANFVDDPTVTIDFDVDLLVFAIVYDYLEDDGTNPGATEKYRAKLNAKFELARAKYGTRIIPFRRGRALPPDAWYSVS
jgi:hypothetical protein